MCLGVNHRPAFGCVKAAIVAQLASVITPFLLRKAIAIAAIRGVDPQADATTQYDQSNYLALEPQNPTAKASDSPRCDIAIKTFEQRSGQTALTALAVSANFRDHVLHETRDRSPVQMRRSQADPKAPL